MLDKSQCTHMWLHWLLQISYFTRQKNLWNWCWTKVNVLTCDYIDFCLAHVTTLTVIYKIYKNCAITFNLHEKLLHSVATIVVFNNGVCKYIVLALFWKVFIKFRHWHDEKLTFAYQWVRRTILFIALRTSSKVLNVDPCFSAQCLSLREYGFHAVLAHFSWKLQKILTFLAKFCSYRLFCDVTAIFLQ